jgi:hypothetical protein
MVRRANHRPDHIQASNLLASARLRGRLVCCLTKGSKLWFIVAVCAVRLLARGGALVRPQARLVLSSSGFVDARGRSVWL